MPLKFVLAPVMDTYHRVCQLAPPICSVERC